MANKKRSHYGEGSIFTTANGQARGVLMVNGKRKYFYGKTEKEVLAKIKAAQKQLDVGTFIEGKDVTLAEYAEYWLRIRKGGNLSRSTINGNEGHIRNYIIPYLGYIKLQKLTGEAITDMYNDLLKKGNKGNGTNGKGMKPTSIAKVESVLNMILAEAVKQKRLSSNPCSLATLPKVRKEEMKFLTLEQACKLLDTATGYSSHIILTLAVYTGMREGEILALHWDDIDFEKKTIHVHQSLSYKADIDTGKYTYQETLPKTDSSNRYIPMVQPVIDALKAHRLKQKEARLVAKNWTDNNLVVTSRDGGFYLVKTLRRQLHSLLKIAELPDMRMHDLRHTAATVFLNLGMSIKAVQKLLGHSNVQTTLKYLHVSDSMLQEAMAQVEEKIKAKLG